MKRYALIPLLLFLVLAGFLARGLSLDPREVPSPLVGRLAPPFELPQLASGQPVFTPEAMRGQVWLLNVWASWCGGCREEHPLLLQLAANGKVPLYGMNYKDTRPEAQRWLAQGGDPYRASVMDADGRVGIDYGVYGVPETYVIDQAGVIAYKHIGPLTHEVLQARIMPLVHALNGKQAFNDQQARKESPGR